MSLQAKTFLNLIAGALAGILAWALTDLTGWFAHVLNANQVNPGSGKYLLYGALFGLLLGLLLGLVDSLSFDSKKQMGAALAWSSAIGFVGGGLGLHFGQSVYGVIVGAGGDAADTPGRFFVLLIARSLGWALIGGIVGAAQGASRRSPAIARQGAFGGLLGGLFGGALFEITANLFGGPVLSRLVALVATGALVGFFVGLVQNLFKHAWIRVVLGRNEGKEYLIARPLFTIGRSELADIGLFGDPAIAPTHAVIESLAAQGRHRLRHVAAGERGGPYPPTVVNGQPVTAEQWLADGDTLQIGRYALLFQEKATRTSPHNLPAPNSGGAGNEGAASSAPTEEKRTSRYVGQELSGATIMSPRSSPVSDATVLVGGLGLGSRLVCTAGPYAGQSFPLTHAPTTMGRAADRDISLAADTSVSRSHARIAYDGSRHVLSDDGSSNGTLVNGLRLDAPRPLSSGDLIHLGDTVLRYE